MFKAIILEAFLQIAYHALNLNLEKNLKDPQKFKIAIQMLKKYWMLF